MFLNSDLAVPAAQKKDGIAAFCGNHALCKITEDLIFTEPYFQAEQIAGRRPGSTRQRQASAKTSTCMWRSRGSSSNSCRPETLVHGDLHTGSIMVTASDTRVIDPEFAFYGPMAFDVGAILANLIMSYLASAGHERETGARSTFEAWVLETIEAVWTQFPANSSPSGGRVRMVTPIPRCCSGAGRGGPAGN